LCHTAGASLRRCRTWNWAWNRSRLRSGRRGSAWLYGGLDVGAVRRTARGRWRRASWSRLTIGAGDGWLHLRPIRWAARGEHRSSRLLRRCPARTLGRSGGGWLRGNRLRGGLGYGLRRWLSRRLGATAEESRDQPLLLRHASPRTSRGPQRGSCNPTRCRTR
jgi:hypothetical protein